MSYDFTEARAALSKASGVSGWDDRKSSQLEREYLLPMERQTNSAENVAEEIAVFIAEVEANLAEITNCYE